MVLSSISVLPKGVAEAFSPFSKGAAADVMLLAWFDTEDDAAGVRAVICSKL